MCRPAQPQLLASLCTRQSFHREHDLDHRYYHYSAVAVVVMVVEEVKAAMPSREDALFVGEEVVMVMGYRDRQGKPS